MSESKHTPMKDVFSMPLQCQGATLRQQDFAYGSRLIADLYDGNAGQRGAAIVRAVNCHDDLLAAAKEALAGIQAEHGQLAVDVNFPLLRAAIAKAEGRS